MPLSISPPAKLFNACADVYQRYRPTYPDQAIETVIKELNLPSQALLCDVGAGPGGLSFLLAQRGLRLVAVEPLAEMRNRGARSAADRELPVAFVGGRAEALPLQAESVEAVVCGQAFHWFDFQTALGEIARLLKPDGGLALLWNNRDWERIKWLQEIERLIMKANPQYHPNYRTKDWAQIVDACRRFRPTERFEFLHHQLVGGEEILGLIESFSYLRVIPLPARQQLKQEVAALLDRELGRGSETCRGSNGRLLLRYRTELYLARKD